jgi:hypothetical protein
MTIAGGLGHTLPYLIANFFAATGTAAVVVVIDLLAIAYIQCRYMDTPPFSAAAKVMLGRARSRDRTAVSAVIRAARSEITFMAPPRPLRPGRAGPSPTAASAANSRRWPATRMRDHCNRWRHPRRAAPRRTATHRATQLPRSTPSLARQQGQQAETACSPSPAFG